MDLSNFDRAKDIDELDSCGGPDGCEGRQYDSEMPDCVRCIECFGSTSEATFTSYPPAFNAWNNRAQENN